MNRKEADPNQLDLFKPQSEPAPKKDDKITSSEWEAANKLAFDMTTPGGKLIKNPTREEREALDEEVKKGFRILRAKLGLPPKEGDQAEMPFDNDKK